MIIAVLKETADYERRVALTPPGSTKADCRRYKNKNGKRRRQSGRICR